MPPSYPKSTTVSANTDATAVQYNSLRADAVEARIVSLTAGEALTALDTVYIKAADGKAYKTKVSSTAAEGVFFGFATNSVSIGGIAVILFDGFIDGFSALSVGSRYFLSTTYGAITASPLDTTDLAQAAVGIAISTTTFMIQPWLPTTTLHLTGNHLTIGGNGTNVATLAHASGSATAQAFDISSSVGDTAVVMITGAAVPHLGSALSLSAGVNASRTDIYALTIAPSPPTTTTITNFFATDMKAKTGAGSVTNYFAMQFTSNYLSGGTTHNTKTDELKVRGSSGTIYYIDLNT